MAKKMKYKFGGVLRKKSIGGQDIARGDQSSSMVRKAMASKGISDDGDEVEGGAPKMRLDRPGRKRGGAVSCKADGGKISADRKEDQDNEREERKSGWRTEKNSDEAEDKKLVAKMIHKHEKHDHEDEKETKFKKGGEVHRKHEMAGGFLNKMKRG